jgi:glycerol-1-phosphate dehydrogenase [NAD(P)+]
MARTSRILFDDVLGRFFECECGLTHHVPTKRVLVEPEVAARTPEILAELAPTERTLIVADVRTWEVAGASLESALLDRHDPTRCIVPDDSSGHLHASVGLVNELADEYPDVFDSYIAVGSGTINDLTKELARRRGRPYLVLATAASMNGYTSSIVALLDGGLKTTGPATPPVAVLADPRVLVAAPLELTLAGLGDLVSKPYCGCDWWVASIVRDEPYCPMPGRMLSEAFDRALDLFPKLAEREVDAVLALFELLVMSGITMTVAGTSSPASGGEHLLSHYWDMTNLRDGRPLKLHGAQVGVASLAMDALYTEVLGAEFGAARFLPGPSLDEAERVLRASLGSLAGVVWPEWRAKLTDRSKCDLDRLQQHEGRIKTEIEQVLATGRKVRRALAGSGAPMSAGDLGISPAELAAALRLGRTIRTRYTVLDVAAELDLLDHFADSYPAG